MVPTCTFFEPAKGLTLTPGFRNAHAGLKIFTFWPLEAVFFNFPRTTLFIIYHGQRQGQSHGHIQQQYTWLPSIDASSHGKHLMNTSITCLTIWFTGTLRRCSFPSPFPGFMGRKLLILVLHGLGCTDRWITATCFSIVQYNYARVGVVVLHVWRI